MLTKLMALTVLAGVVGEPALSQTAGDPYRGKSQAERLCATCHAIEPGARESPDPKATPFSVVGNTKGMTSLALSVWLQTSHPTMPNIKLGPETADDIVAYILTLKGNRG